MDVDAIPNEAHNSEENLNGNSPCKKNTIEGAEDEEIFYDADESVKEKSSDITPPDNNFSIASENLIIDTSDGISDENSSNSPVCSNVRKTNPRPHNFNDASTEFGSSESENDSTKIASTFSFYDDDVSGQVQDKDFDSGEAYVPEVVSNETIENCNDDFNNDKNCHNDIYDGTLEESNISTATSTKSSMEIMEDDSDSFSSEKISNEPPSISEQTMDKTTDLPSVSTDGIVRENMKLKDTRIPANIDSNVNEMSKNFDENVYSKNSQEAFHDTEIQTAVDCSDVDSVGSVNLEETVEESSNSSTLDDGKTDLSGKNVDSTSSVVSSVKRTDEFLTTPNILDEFHDDAEDVYSGNADMIDFHSCPCEVVLFRVDFDERVSQRLGSADKISQLTSSDSDSSFSRLRQSIKRTRSNKIRGTFNKANKKLSGSSENDHDSLSSVTSSSTRASSSSGESIVTAVRRRRKSIRQTITRNSLKYSDRLESSSDSDETPLSRMVRKRKRKSVVINRKKSPLGVGKSPKKNVKGMKNANSIVSLEKNSAARRNGRTLKNNNDKDVNSRGIFAQKTLKCVSIPVITEIIKSLKGNSYEELVALMNADTASPIKKIAINLPKLNETVNVERRSTRKQISSDSGDVETEDKEYKVYAKLWRHDRGTGRPDAPFALRSSGRLQTKKSVRKSAKPRSYAESSESDIDDAFSTKHVKKSKRNASDS